MRISCGYKCQEVCGHYCFIVTLPPKESKEETKETIEVENPTTNIKQKRSIEN